MKAESKMLVFVRLKDLCIKLVRVEKNELRHTTEGNGGRRGQRVGG